IRCPIFRLGRAASAEETFAYDRARCVMVSARSLAAILQDPAISADSAEDLFNRTPFVLVYGINGDSSVGEGIRRITGGAVTRAVGFGRPEHRYEVSWANPEITKEFNGLSFGVINSQTDWGLICEGHNGALTSLVSANGLPILASLKKAHSLLFLLG